VGAQALPDEVRLSSSAAARTACDEASGRGRKAEAALATVYVMTVEPGGFAFQPYDAPRARLALDAVAFRGSGGLELTPHDLVGTTRPGGLDLSVPASAEEADALVRAQRGAALTLSLWFRIAHAAEGRPCAVTHRGTYDGLRLAIEPLAFELRQGNARVASGETAAFASLRAEASPVLEPRVVVGAPFRTDVRGKAPPAIARAAQMLERSLMTCYRRGLKSDPFLRGPLALGAEVSVDGRVTTAYAEVDGLGAPDVVTCAVETLRGARFPRGSTRLSIPVEFTD
jgi:hypothetical protein